MIIQEIPNLYRIIPMQVLRQTSGVNFDSIPPEHMPRVDAVDRVLHHDAAISPGSVGDVERPWYMHTHQDDNLMVFYGERYVDIYTPEHGCIEKFTVTPTHVMHNGEVIYDKGAMLVWPCGVFHRIQSHKTLGSISVNLATHYEGFDIRTNFNIYDLDPKTGTFHVLREGHQDQPE